MKKLVYRDANESDLDQIVRIYNTTIKSRMVTADIEPVTVESKLNWFFQHDPNKFPLWVVEEEDKIIGWVSLHVFYGRPAHDSTVEISIYLDENQRGKGIGKKVLDDCMTKARDIGIKTILGFIFSHNLPSLKLFKSFGFDVWGVLPNVAVLDGEERSLSILGKRIFVD